MTGGKTSVTLLHGAQENLSSKADTTEPSSSDRHFRPTRESSRWTIEFLPRSRERNPDLETGRSLDFSARTPRNTRLIIARLRKQCFTKKENGNERHFTTSDANFTLKEPNAASLSPSSNRTQKNGLLSAAWSGPTAGPQGKPGDV